jgi:hypothetical protein
MVMLPNWMGKEYGVSTVPPLALPPKVKGCWVTGELADPLTGEFADGLTTGE